MILRDNSGQALVEFAIVAPLLFMILFGIMELALMFNAYEMVHYAAFTAARTAIVYIPRGDYPPTAPEAMYRIAQTGEKTPKLDAIRRAAAIVLTPISSPATGKLLAGLKKMRGALMLLSGGVIQKCGIPFPRDICSVPGLRIFCGPSLPGEGMITPVSGEREEARLAGGVPVDGAIIPVRRLITARLATTAHIIDQTTGKEIEPAHPYRQGKAITVEVTHLYNLKIPFIRRVIWILYVRFSLMKKIQRAIEEIEFPEETTEEVGECIEEEVRALLKRLNSPYYPIPITARYTLALE